MEPAPEPKRNDERRAGFAFVLGISLGTALGIALDNPGVGIALGAAFGIIFAGATRARDKNKTP